MCASYYERSKYNTNNFSCLFLDVCVPNSLNFISLHLALGLFGNDVMTGVLVLNQYFPIASFLISNMTWHHFWRIGIAQFIKFRSCRKKIQFSFRLFAKLLWAKFQTFTKPTQHENGSIINILSLFNLNSQSDCPNGRLTPAKFVDMYKMFFPSGNAEEFCDHVFRTFDMDKNGYIDFKVSQPTRRWLYWSFTRFYFFTWK